SNLDNLLQSCVQCGLCLSHCATYLVTGNEAFSPRGRLQLLKHWQNSEPDKDQLHALDSCIGCLACESACPSGVPYDLIEQGKSRATPNWRKHLASPLSNPKSLQLFSKLSEIGIGYASKITPKSMTDEKLVSLLDGLTKQKTAVRQLTKIDSPSVMLFPGCVNSTMLSRSQKRLIQLLESAGCRVEFPESWNCCGAVASHLDNHSLTEIQHKQNLKTDCDYIVVEAAGCGRELKSYAGDKVIDASVLLSKLNLNLHETDLKVAMHYPCHSLHGQKIVEEPRRLLANAVQAIDPHEPEVCCGSGGTFTLFHKELSIQAGKRKAKMLTDTTCDIAITSNAGCLGQLTNSLGKSMPIIPLTDLVWYLQTRCKA
ncbi:(Fe-S)-binding protein, partial [bacterium]|nr:(Fe-S)-binding protein [bacterium]